MNLNKVFIIGRLTQDVEMKYLPSGTPVATINVATNRVYRDKDGQQREETQYHRVIAWSKLAELCKQFLTKGRLVYVEGRLSYRSWLTVTGDKRNQTEIVAERIQFGPRKGELGVETEPIETISEFEQEIPEVKDFEVPY
jgi:single-strand DNA-binding protein